ncbi:hypothetical protein IPM65_06880 [Candidatus Roizmanbacteria bacterium]|nr:MAG: hypothetical protein IPM65_06880 [Candidatus Roizmanbacteria bacterium]
MIAPDTQQNLLYTIYFILIHNFEAILYSVGIIIALIISLYKPSRGKILIMWGFIILLFAFEYDKHILEPLRQQTIGSLITERQSFRIEHTINYVTMRVLPKALPFFGWMLVIGGIFFDKIIKAIQQRLHHNKKDL